MTANLQKFESECKFFKQKSRGGAMPLPAVINIVRLDGVYC